MRFVNLYCAVIFRTNNPITHDYYANVTRIIFPEECILIQEHRVMQ